MYFDFDDRYESVEEVGSAISRREGVVLSVVVHVARFSQALSRARRRASELKDLRDPTERPHAEARRAAYDRLLDSVLPERRYLERLVVRKGERLLFVPIAEVDRFSAEGNYVEVHSGGASHLIRDTLAHIESQLDPAAFVRVHRGEIVAQGSYANGNPKRCPPHPNAGVHALPHYQPDPRPPDGHTFYETTNLKAF